jgi:hypothetical protein
VTQLIPVKPQDQHSDNRRTRRNVVAMGGMISSFLLASIVGAKSAEAGDGDGNGHRHSGGFGDGNGHRNSGGSCFLSGTHVRTEAGEVSIESLQTGASLLTASGQARAVKQIHRWEAVREPGQDWAKDVAPIKVACSALAPNVPHRDLYLSPLHAVYIDGVLIRVGALVNGRSVVRCSKYEADRLSYFHVELDDHQVLFAEGASVESKLDEHMVPFAPIGIGSGRRSELASRLRSAVSPWLDNRQVFDKVRDRLEVRAESNLGA